MKCRVHNYFYSEEAGAMVRTVNGQMFHGGGQSNECTTVSVHELGVAEQVGVPQE